MLQDPQTIEDAQKVVYGETSYRKGRPYKEGYCVEQVWNGPREMINSQCSRRNGQGPGGLYCKQHAKIKEG